MVSTISILMLLLVWRKEDNSYKKSAFGTPLPRGIRVAPRRPITNKLNAYGGAICTRVDRIWQNAQKFGGGSALSGFLVGGKRSAVERKSGKFRGTQF